MKRLITYSCMAIFAMGSMAQNQKDEAQMNRFISGLMKKMTLEEKVGQLSQCSGGFATGPDNTRISRTEDISKGLIGSLLNVSGAANTRKYQEAAMKSRLQIPLLFGLDVIHGYRTGFPLPLAEAASFDLDAIERGSRCAAKEAAAAGLHWTFAPMVDISWDARWGRVMEGAGEDPYYGSLVAKARVHGLQGDDLSKENTILSCIKHFAGYGAAIAGKDYNSVDMSMGQFANFYMPPYKAGAEAGAATFMSAVNDFNNEPSTGSTFLLRELLKNQWGFKGFVVSDWGSVGEMMNHRYAKDEKEAAYKFIKWWNTQDKDGSSPALEWSLQNGFPAYTYSVQNNKEYKANKKLSAMSAANPEAPTDFIVDSNFPGINSVLSDVIPEMINSVAFGNSSVEDALAKAQKSTQKIVDKYNK